MRYVLVLCASAMCYALYAMRYALVLYAMRYMLCATWYVYALMLAPWWCAPVPSHQHEHLWPHASGSWGSWVTPQKVG